MGSTKSHWIQLPPPKTYREKYKKLRELIIDRYNATKYSKHDIERNNELMTLRVLINTMERKDDKYNPWDMTKE